MSYRRMRRRSAGAVIAEKKFRNGEKSFRHDENKARRKIGQCMVLISAASARVGIYFRRALRPGMFLANMCGEFFGQPLTVLRPCKCYRACRAPKSWRVRFCESQMGDRGSH